MDVRNRARSGGVIFFAACLHLLMGATALADPLYTIIDLGTSPTYGVDSSGNGTITGSNGLTYTFNPVQNYLPAQWNNTTQGVPIVYPAPVGLSTATIPFDPNSPNFAFSYSYLNYMNSQGLAAGVNLVGVQGHDSNSEVFLTQLQANGSWGAPIPLWSGGMSSYGPGMLPTSAITGISPNGQVLGFGGRQWQFPSDTKYLYNTKTQSLTNLTSLIISMNWDDQPASLLKLDNQGRILTQATPLGPGYSSPHTLLLIPQGVSADPIPVPEPESWAVFATLIGGLIVHKRLRSRTRSWT
ncbi:MAG: hypothetical protein ACLQU5_32850 [Isosphaeraceae bacterium]